jgi:DNA-binding LacI/PurR family transcriptional regulator
MRETSPLVTAVVEEMAGRIQRGELGTGKGLPSERRLVEQLQVSRGIVRRAIQQMDKMGLILCQPNCRPIVRGTIDTKRAPAATGLRHIAIWVWPSTGHYSAASILKGIQSVQIPDDVRLVVASVPHCDSWEACLAAEQAFLRSIASDRCTVGLIIYYLGGERNLDALRAVRDAGIAISFVDRLPPAPFDGDYFGSDNEAAMQLAVKHLIETGHRRIALISNQDEVSTVVGREAGYRQALRESRIPLDDELVRREEIGDPNGVESAVEELLRLDSPPTAIVGVNDHIALQIYEEMHSRGHSVPGEVSILGFDGLLRWVPGGGYLTTCCQDFERMGRLATEAVIERTKGGAPRAFRHVFLNAPLIVRGSTDRPRISTSLHCTCIAE